jgi:uncharacterized protein (TIGR00369 family)
MQQRTHAELDAELCGEPSELEDGLAVVDLVTSHRMRADGHDLVHGGFVFGLADHAAMLAINHPNVVLGNANIRFERPVTVGERLRARARVRAVQGKKHIVDVEVERPRQGSEATTPEIVMRGELTCFTPERHVLVTEEAST